MGSTSLPHASPILPQNGFPELLPFPKRGKLVIAIWGLGAGLSSSGWAPLPFAPRVRRAPCLVVRNRNRRQHSSNVLSASIGRVPYAAPFSSRISSRYVGKRRKSGAAIKLHKKPHLEAESGILLTSPTRAPLASMEA